MNTTAQGASLKRNAQMMSTVKLDETTSASFKGLLQGSLEFKYKL